MASPVRNSNGLVYPLILAYALVVLSLWKLDAGMAGSSFLISTGDNNADAKRYPRSQRLETSHLHSRGSSLEQSTIDLSNGDGAETKHDELRRLAVLALIKHAAEDGIRGGRAVEPRRPKD